MPRGVLFRSAVVAITASAICVGTFSQAAMAGSAPVTRHAVERAGERAELPILRADTRAAFGKDWHDDPHDRRGPHWGSGDWRYGDKDGHRRGRDRDHDDRDRDDRDYGDRDYGDRDYGDRDYDDRRHDDRDYGDRDYDDRDYGDRDYDHRDRGRDDHDSDKDGLDQTGLAAILIGGALLAVLIGTATADD